MLLYVNYEFLRQKVYIQKKFSDLLRTNKKKIASIIQYLYMDVKVFNKES